MVLSGAERQKRYREKLLAAARGSDLGDRAREAMDEAIALLYSIIKRPGPDGSTLAEGDDFADLDAYRVYWAKQMQDGDDAAHWISAYLDDATDEERPVLERAIAVANAVRLSHVAIPAKTKRRGK